MTTSPEIRRVFKGFVMNPIEPGRVEVYDPGYLVVAGGRIEALTRNRPGQDSHTELIVLENKIIVPGFVDVHVHLPQYAIMGVGVGELLTWLETYTYPEEARFADPEYASGISNRFFDDMIANGTTAAAIYSSVHEEATDIAFHIAQAKGVRAFIGKVMMDQNSPAAMQESTDASIAASIRLFDKWDGADNGRLRYVFTPRYAGCCSMELMRRVGSIARDRAAFVQTHLSENKDEIELIRKLFPGVSYAGIYESAGLLHGQSIVAHCIHLSTDEIAMLTRHKARLAFCPLSNRTLRSGTMPYRTLREAGLDIALGTDIAGGPSLSMLVQMDEAISAASIADEEALYLATLAGARTLGLSDQIGSFAAGKDADFVILGSSEALPPRRSAQAWKQHLVEEVYVQGRQVYFRKA
jgi:guanine deaminase